MLTKKRHERYGTVSIPGKIKELSLKKDAGG